MVRITTPEQEELERRAVVTEALTWQNTPYHHMGRVKGAGVDCGMLLAEVFEQTGLVPHLEVPYYPRDWNLHRKEPVFMKWLEQYAVKVDCEPRPGDIVMFRYGWNPSHGSIVIEWPVIIHAWINVGVIQADALKEPLDGKMTGIYSAWGR